MEFNKKIFEELKPMFYSKGFNDSQYFKNHGGLEYYKKKNDSIYWVRLTFALNNDAFVQINSYISFPSVTNILGKFISINKDFQEEIVKNHYIKKEWSDLIQKLCSLPLKTGSDIEIFKLNISQHLDNYISPFFNKVPNLKAVNDEILNKVPDDEYTNYIPKQTNFKVLIIMKLCNNPKYEEFKNWALEAYKRGAELDSDKYGSDYKILKNLILYLDNEKYKESTI